MTRISFIYLILATILFSKDVYLSEEHEELFKDGPPASHLPSKMPRESKLLRDAKRQQGISEWRPDTFHNLYEPGEWWSRERYCWSFYNDFTAYCRQKGDGGLIDSTLLVIFLPFKAVFNAAGIVYVQYIYDPRTCNRLKFIRKYDSFCRWSTLLATPFILMMYGFLSKLWILAYERHDLDHRKWWQWCIGIFVAYYIGGIYSCVVAEPGDLSNWTTWFIILTLVPPAVALIPGGD